MLRRCWFRISPGVNDVFVQALLIALVATLAICLPVIFAPALRRSGALRRVGVVCAVVAAGALGLTGWQAAIGVRSLVRERPALQAEVARTYGLVVSEGQADELIDGGRPLVRLPLSSERLGLAPNRCRSLRLVPFSTLVAHTSAVVPADIYGLELSGVPVRYKANRAETAEPCTQPSS